MTVYRLIRGEHADYHDEEFDDEALRNEAAQAYAKQDDDEVLLEYLDDETGQWWCTGAAYPPGKEPAPVDPRNRYTAVVIMPGDRVTVFGTLGTYFDTSQTTEYTGVVVAKQKREELHHGIDGWMIQFDDGRIVTCIDHAATTIHDLDISERIERYGDTGEEA